MRTGLLSAGLAVADFPRALEWYARFSDRDPDVVPHDREVMWPVAGRLYVVEDPDRADRGLVSPADRGGAGYAEYDGPVAIGRRSPRVPRTRRGRGVSAAGTASRRAPGRGGPVPAGRAGGAQAARGRGRRPPPPG